MDPVTAHILNIVVSAIIAGIFSVLPTISAQYFDRKLKQEYSSVDLIVPDGYVRRSTGQRKLLSLYRLFLKLPLGIRYLCYFIVITALGIVIYYVIWGMEPTYYSAEPAFEITEIIPDDHLFLQGHDLPSKEKFNVLIASADSENEGAYNWIPVASAYSGKKGTIPTQFLAIPPEIQGSKEILLQFEFESITTYERFRNTYESEYAGYPYFFIQSVVSDRSVTIIAYNFPPNDTYVVTMGQFGSYGIGGLPVATTTTDESGKFTAMYDVPLALSDSDRIAIRLQSPTTGYYAYNWFYNKAPAP